MFKKNAMIPITTRLYVNKSADEKNPEMMNTGKTFEEELGFSEDAMRGLTLIKTKSVPRNNKIKALNYLLELENFSCNGSGRAALSDLLDLIANYDYDSYFETLEKIIKCSDDLKPTIRGIQMLTKIGMDKMYTDRLQKMVQDWHLEFQEDHDLPF
ncbi:MAG: hypothetical protein ACOYIC_04235 [Butyricicoccus sp.]